ncbi:MAG TPA: PqqD family peptide modification chaperone [Actinomycetota bacterium]
MTDQLETEVIEETEEIEADDIELDFVPHPRDTIVATEFDGELLLIDRETGFLSLLDPVGSIVWHCLDGKVKLADLAEELAEAFGAPVDVVRRDVLEMVRSVGRAGLLNGVAPPPQVSTAQPTGMDLGEELVPFTAPDLDGATVDLAGLRSQRVLLVNWSPHCGYCAKVAPDLAELQPGLAEQGVSLVFLTAGEADANRELLETHGLAATTLLREGTDDDFADPFPAMGTPVAYLLDAEGRVAEPLAYGALEVPVLARRAAGVAEPEANPVTDQDHDPGQDHDHEHDEAPAERPRYMPASAGVCGPGTGSGKKPREWAKTSAYAVGEFHIGVRADSLATDDLLARVFAAHRLPDDVEAPDNFSVVLGEAGRKGARSLNLLLWANTTVVRSRSPRRVVQALASHVSSVFEPEDGLLRTTNVGALIGDTAILLPSVVTQWLEDVQPRLSRLGVRLVDEPFSTIDLERLELVVPEPRVQLDQAALAGVLEPAQSRSELPRVEPGRYPLRAWTLWETDELEGQFSRARAVAASLPSVISDPDDLDDLLPQLGRLVERISPVPLVFDTPEELSERLKEQLPALR